MKKMIGFGGSYFMFDPETENIELVERSREAIRSIVKATEDCKLKAKDGDNVVEYDVKAGDIIINFYESEFPNRTIVISSDKWAENIDTYEKVMKARREKMQEEASCVPNAQIA